MARPTKLDETILETAKQYVDDSKNMSAQVLLPTIEGLALKLEISRDTVYDWEKLPELTEKNEADRELHKRFSYIVQQLRAAQAEKLIQNGLAGRYNPTIAKLILSGKHNYVEKSEVDNNHSGAVSFVNDVPRPNKSQDA